MPKTLDEIYGHTLLAIAEEKREYAQRLFRCLTVSIRPLRVEELAGILAVDFDEAALPTFKAAWRSEDSEEALMSVCSSLIAIVDRGDYQVVQFSHFSVREYLTSERLAKSEEGLSYYHILPEPAHTIFAQASPSVILQLDDKIDRNTLSHFPLAPYAAQHWVDHARFTNVSSHIQDIIERLFDPTKSHFSAWVWLYDIDHYWKKPLSGSEIHPTRPKASSLYYAALLGFRGLAAHLITSHSQDVNSRGGFYITPLHAASVKGHLDVASLLLENVADPNSRDNRDIAELLVESGASLDVRNGPEWTPLHMACENGKLDVARFLIGRGSNINSRENNGRIPLHMASHMGHLDIARLLLDCGSDVNARDFRDWTPLHFASQKGHLGLVRHLIDRRADLNAQEEDHWTPMHFASSYGYLEIVKLLVERGACVDSRNDKKETPLDRAAKKGFYDIARFLVQSGAAVSVRDDKGSTPFHKASYCGISRSRSFC